MTDQSFKFTDRATIIPGTRKTEDGYLVGKVKCARTGCQEYTARDFGLLDEDPDRVITVYRPESAVFDSDSLKTFGFKPVTVDHPPEMVNDGNWSKYAVGDIGGKIVREGDFVEVDFRVMDGKTIAMIEDGSKNETSMGYTTPIVFQDGVAPDGTEYQAIQTGPIKINHLALVDRARGGSALRIGDGAGESWGVSPHSRGITPQNQPEKENLMADTKLVVFGDKAAQIPLADAAIVEGFRDAMNKKVADMETAHIAAIEAKDAEIAKAEAAKDAAEEKILSDEALDLRIQHRADLINDAKRIDPTFETKGVSDANIRKGIVTAKLGDAKIAGKSDAYIEARFDGMIEALGEPDAFADGITSRATPPAPGADPRDQAFADNLTNLADAHKQPINAAGV